ncbi:MAG: dTMP kinase [Thermoanaerobaculia bacterium]
MTTFVTFEGPDGSGKSTHLRRVAEALRERGLDHVSTHEPGGTDLGRAVRELFLSPRCRTEDGMVEALLVFAARRQHVREVIEPALAGGRHVLCDRFTDSTLAYQGYGRGASVDALLELDRLATGGLRPDRTLLFDLPPDQALARGQSEKRRNSAGGLDRLDSERLDFYSRVRDGFLALAEREPGRFRVIDASGSVEETHAQVRRALEGLFR